MRALWSSVQLLLVLIVYVSTIILQSATDRGWWCVGGLLGVPNDKLICVMGTEEAVINSSSAPIMTLHEQLQSLRVVSQPPRF